MNVEEADKRFKEEVGDIQTWCHDTYEGVFSSYFKDTDRLYLRLQKDRNKMSDDELEDVLTYLPLQLLEVSEILSQYKLSYECLKLHIKKIEAEAISNSTAKTVTEKKEQAALEVMDYKVLLHAYGSIIDRVENELNFSREFIMTAKKLWDSRMHTYNANPISDGRMAKLETYDPDDRSM